jgi:amino acid adenylation domain-containing protein
MSHAATNALELSAARRALLDALLRGNGLRASAPSGAIPCRSGDGTAPLSFAQERLWFFDQLQPGSAAYNLPSAIRLRGALDVPALEQSLAEIIRRHEVLRTTVGMGSLGPVQVIAPPGPCRLSVTDLRDLPEPAREAETRRRAVAEARRPFDLEQGPLLRAELLCLAEAEHVLLLSVHHLVADGWSIGVLVRELAALYVAYCTGQPSPLPPTPIQYTDYAVWQRQWLQGDILDRQLAYWKQQLAGLAPLRLPSDRPRPAAPSLAGAVQPFTLSRGLAADLQALCRREGATLFMALLGAFQVLLGRYAGQDDVAVGTPVANRTRPELEGLIGLFVNTLVLRADLSGNPTFRELLGRVREAALQAFDHQDLPFEKLVEEVQPERDPSRHPLFQVMFVLQNVPSAEPAHPGLELSYLEVDAPSMPFDLVLSLMSEAGGLIGSLAYSTDLFDALTVARMAGHYRRLLEGVVADPDQRLSELPLLTEAERRQLLVEWRGPRAACPCNRCVHELFEEQAARTPDAVAVACGQEQLSYRQLDRRANQLAHFLRRAGVGPEVRVGLCLERSAELLVGLLGILKAGAAYVPLDPTYPGQRLALLLEDSQAAVLLTRQEVVTRLPDSGARVICLDADREALVRSSQDDPQHSASADNLAYVIYTSGSTGRPKGVLVRHRSLVCSTLARSHHYREPVGKYLLLSSFAFDSSVAGIFWTLCQGGTLVLPPDGGERDPRRIIDLIAGQQVSHVLCLPTVYGLVLAEEQPQRLASLRTVIVAGETCPVDVVVRHRGALPLARLFNEYGPTEATVWTTVHDCSAKEPGRVVPIGRPIANTRVYLLDRFLNPVPVGVPGELYVGGPGVSAGYHNAPERTAERFLPDPFGEEIGGRLYMTGDLARYRPDGVIELLGRVDQQVKVRGFRVEPGEIEAVLASHPGLRQAVVLAREEAPGDQRLIAYVVPGPEATPFAAELRDFLRAKLPDYLVPAAFVVLDALPRTPNGKIDRRALPATDRRGLGSPGRVVAPRTPIEEVLVGIWRDVLGVERVGIDDNFFDLGGHSLLATRVITRVRQALHVEVPLRVLFETPTVAGLGRSVETARQAGQGLPPLPLRPVPRVGNLPVSFAQQRLWFLEQLQPGSSAYTLATAVRFTGDLQVQALAQSFSEIVHRHEVLRTTITAVGGEPVQVIAAPQPLPMPVIDLQHLPEDERETEVRSRIAAEAGRAFDLERGPLLRVQLLCLGQQDHVLLFACHHIVSDGWSMGVLLHELAALYPAFAAGQPSPLPPLPIQYADYAAWQRHRLQGKVLAEQLAYWREQLRDAAVLELPTDRVRPAVMSFRGATQSFALSRSLSEAIKALSRREGATPFMTLLAAFQALLGRHAGQDDVVVGTPIANRAQAELEGLIGFFVNTLVLRGDLSGNPTFRELLSQVRQAALGAYDHQDLPFEKLVEELQPQRDVSRNPLFQVMFALQNVPQTALELSPLQVRRLGIEEPIAKFDLSLDLVETEEGLVGSCEYSTDLFEEATIRRLLGQYQRLLEGIVADPEQRLDDLPLLTEAERQHILAASRGGPAGCPPAGCLHAWFEQQATRTPDALAVVAEDEQLSYRQLDRRANQLAHRLRRAGVAAEGRVGICLQRGPEAVVGLLGILKAGGVYVPLDPAYPPERLALLLHAAGVQVLLTEHDLLARLPPHQGITLCLDSDSQRIASEPEECPRARVDADNLAYVLYTSGSTGRPNGVAVSHRAAVAHFTTFLQELPFRPSDRVLQFASLAFDTSLEDLFPALLSGAALVLRGPELWAPAEFLRQVRRWGVTVLNLPTAYWHELVQHLHEPGAADVELRQALNAQLRHVEIGGEAVQREAVRMWQRAGLPGVRLVNSYGPTEATVTATAYDVPARQEALPAGRVPIGGPLGGRSAHVLDRRGRQVPLGVPGELCLGGLGLARGYLDAAERTAERFVPDPFSGEAGARLYRTGDRARWRADGTLELLGRLDAQVKVRGFRVEPAEVEAALAEHPGVREIAVLARADAPGDQHLIAYVAPRTGASLTVEDLCAFLRERLPDYLRPAALVFLDALPMTPNGKIDRRALPAPVRLEKELATRQRPPTPVEEVLAEIWREVLGVERVGIDDNFFDLGGHSLRAVRLLFRIQALFGQEVSLKEFFQAPTIEQLACVLSRGSRSCASPLIALRPEGSQPPFFCVHPLGGTVLCYFDLARSMGPHQPFYGLRAVGLDGEREPHARIEDMADHYVTALRQLQPEGPYLLGGWSMGGLVAVEMAQQLQRSGCRVALVGLLDTWAPGSVFAEEDDATLLAEIASDLNIVVSEEDLRRLSPEEQLDHVVTRAAATSQQDAGVMRSLLLRSWNVCRCHEQSLRNYKAAVYQGSITLFRASEDTPSTGKDQANGWEALVAGGIEIHDLPATHLTLIQQPCARLLARQLQECIDRALRGVLVGER